MMWTSTFMSKKARFSATGLRPAKELRVMIDELIPLYKSGEIKSVIDRTYSLAETADAHRYIETGRKKGNVVVSLII
jgi:NADPH:quinone reductase-like Zn-dependent oxidoreductase